MWPGSPSSSTSAAGGSSTTSASPSPTWTPSSVTRRIVFLESSDDALVRRFESVRRPHPLQGDGRIVDGIAAERELLRELRGDADLVIDTSSLNVHELRAKMDAQFAGDEEPELRATVMSFGFKYGLPVDADLVVDMPLPAQPALGPGAAPLHRPQRGGVERTSSTSPAPRSSSTATPSCSSSSPRATAARASGT